MGVIQNANYLRRVSRHKCDLPNPIVAIETGLAAAAPLLFVPFTFSCTDWVKSAVGISWKCGKKLNTVAKHVYGPKFVNGATLFYELSGLSAIESALWAWFVADLAVDFTVNWISLIFIEQGCDLPRNGTLQCGLGALVLCEGESGHMLIDCLGGRGCVSIGGNKISFPGGCYGEISYSATWEPWTPGADHCSVTTWIEDDSGRKYNESTTQPPTKGNRQETGGFLDHLDARLIAGTEYQIGYRVNSGCAVCTHGSLTATGHGKPQPLIPAGCFSGLGEKLGL